MEPVLPVGAVIADDPWQPVYNLDVVEQELRIEQTGNKMHLITAQRYDEDYEKVVIYLHGGGSDGRESFGLLESGFFGSVDDISGIKFIFPSSTLSNNGNWYRTYTADSVDWGGNLSCEFGLFDSCSYNLDDMEVSGKEIAALIQTEISEHGIDP